MLGVKKLRDDVIGGYLVTKEDGLRLSTAPLEELCQSADLIREHFCGDGFDLCSIVNAKSGRCGENCKFCAQSSVFRTDVETYPLKSAEEIVKQAKYNYEHGILRYSVVTSGKRLSVGELEQVCGIVKEIKKHTGLSVCASLGLLSADEFKILKQAGLSRVHNNLETSQKFFPKICTTHTFEDKVKSVQAARQAGLQICSGGIMGLGESYCDRIDMALTLRQLNIKSVPINMLSAIEGTPLAGNKRLNIDDMRRIVAVFRFILPDASIRLAGGRGLLSDKGALCFRSGANAAISGDMLTTSGISIEKDLQIISHLGYKAETRHE